MNCQYPTRRVQDIRGVKDAAISCPFRERAPDQVVAAVTGCLPEQANNGSLARLGIFRKTILPIGAGKHLRQHDNVSSGLCRLRQHAPGCSQIPCHLRTHLHLAEGKLDPFHRAAPENLPGAAIIANDLTQGVIPAVAIGEAVHQDLRQVTFRGMDPNHLTNE